MKDNMNILTLLNAVYEIVKQVELALPNGLGTEKFDAALERLNIEAGEFIKDKMPLVKSFINGSVAILNILGVFKKKPTFNPAG